jgi:hypothetical protein
LGTTQEVWGFAALEDFGLGVFGTHLGLLHKWDVPAQLKLSVQDLSDSDPNTVHFIMDLERLANGPLMAISHFNFLDFITVIDSTSMVVVNSAAGEASLEILSPSFSDSSFFCTAVDRKILRLSVVDQSVEKSLAVDSGLRGLDEVLGLEWVVFHRGGGVIFVLDKELALQFEVSHAAFGTDFGYLVMHGDKPYLFGVGFTGSPSHFFFKITEFCHPLCLSECEERMTTESHNCLDCVAGYSLVGKNCVKNCLADEYNNTPVTCTACPSCCSTCSLDSSENIVCSSSVGESAIFDYTTQSCYSCPSCCSTCTYTTEDQFSCTSSDPAQAFDPNDQTCRTCPSCCPNCQIDQNHKFLCSEPTNGFIFNEENQECTEIPTCLSSQYLESAVSCADCPSCCSACSLTINQLTCSQIVQGFVYSEIDQSCAPVPSQSLLSVSSHQSSPLTFSIVFQSNVSLVRLGNEISFEISLYKR